MDARRRYAPQRRPRTAARPPGTHTALWRWIAVRWHASATERALRRLRANLGEPPLEVTPHHSLEPRLSEFAMGFILRPSAVAITRVKPLRAKVLPRRSVAAS